MTERAKQARPQIGGIAVGLGSASGGLAAGTGSVVGKFLIIASPLISAYLDFALMQVRSSLERWDARRPIRQARRTLTRRIKHSSTPAERKKYERALAALDDKEVEAAVQLAFAVVNAPGQPRPDG